MRVLPALLVLGAATFYAGCARSTSSTSSTTAMVGVGATAVSGPRPDFSGTWTLDVGQSSAAGGGVGGGRGAGTSGGGGLGLGPSPTQLTIRQDAESITIDERYASTSARRVYRLDGRRTTNVVASARGAGAPATFTSAWNGERLVTSISVAPPRGSGLNLEYEESLYLSTGGLMVVDIARRGQSVARRVVYRREPPPTN